MSAIALAAADAFFAVKSFCATVTGNLTDLSLAPLTTTLTFIPTNAVLLNPGGLSAGPPESITATNGAFSLSLDAGDYTVCLPLVPTRSCFSISVPPTTNTYNITNLITGGAYIYQAPSPPGIRATNAIANFNGFGTNTTLFNPSADTLSVSNGAFMVDSAGVAHAYAGFSAGNGLVSLTNAQLFGASARAMNNFKLNYLSASGYLLSADNSLGIINSAVDQNGLEQWYPVRNDAGHLTNYYAVGLIATNQPPIITVSAIGLAAGAPFTNNGLMFGPDTPGTLTSGIQEALNSMATPTNVIGYRTNNGVISRITSDAGGGILQLAKGTFVCSAPIVLPSTNPVNLRIEGAGMVNSLIKYVASSNSPLLLNLPRASAPDPRIEASDYDFRNVGFLGNLTNTSPLILFSSVNNARLDHCLIASAGVLTNLGGQGAGIQMADDYNPAPGGLIGVVITNNGDNCVEFESCFFLGLAWGLDIYSDHNRVRDCNFGACGSWAKTSFGTLYPTNSIRCFGGAILDQSGGDIVIEGNHFFHCPCGVLANSSGSYGGPIYQNNLIEDCNYGFIGGQAASLINNQYHVVHKQTLGFVNSGSPQSGVSASSDGQNMLTYALMMDADNNFLSVAWNEYPFLALDPSDNLVLPLGSFVGDASGLTNLSAAALATNSPWNGAGLVAAGDNAAKWTRDGSSWTNLASSNIVGSRFVLSLSGSATNLAARSPTNTLAALAVTGPGSAEDFSKPGILSVNGTGNTNLLQIAEYIDGSHQFPELNFKGNANNLGTWNFMDFVTGLRCGYVQFHNTGGIGSSDFGMDFNSDNGQNLVVTYNGDLNVTGSKNFLIPHPLSSSSSSSFSWSRSPFLRHATVEAPRGDLLYRGSVTLTNGLAVDSIDRASGMTTGTFAALTHSDPSDPSYSSDRLICAFAQNQTGWEAVRAAVIGGHILIECANTNSHDRVTWAVIAERADPAYLSSASVRAGIFITEPTK